MVESRAELAQALLKTSASALIGFALSTLSGIAIAVLLSSSRAIQRAFYPYAVFFQTVPIIAIAPLLVIWFGYGMQTVVASAFVVSIFPGDREHAHAAFFPPIRRCAICSACTAHRTLVTLFKLRFPAALPQILTGTARRLRARRDRRDRRRIHRRPRPGSVVDVARTQQRVDKVFAAVLLASVLGLALFGLINLVSYVTLRRWHASEQACYDATIVQTDILLCSQRADAPALGCWPRAAKSPGKIRLALNWKPDPQFGGFYAAPYQKHGLDVEILPGGAGTPTVQMVGAGSAEFGIVSADELVVARSHGNDVVALFAVFQNNPQGIMVHASRNLAQPGDVLKSGGRSRLQRGFPTRACSKRNTDSTR